MRWLKAMYVANILVAGPLGLANLVAPATMQRMMAIPAEDPISFGIGNGAIPLAFGLAGIAGLRAPRRIAPVLALQLLYKSLFLVGVVVPLAATSGIPPHAYPVVGIFVFFIVGNAIAVPWTDLAEPRATSSKQAS